MKIKFKNGSTIETIDTKDKPIRGKRALIKPYCDEEQNTYYSDVYKKYTNQSKVYKNKPWKLYEDITGQKCKWYQKISMCVKSKFFDIRDYYTNPYKIINRLANKHCKK